MESPREYVKNSESEDDDHGCVSYPVDEGRVQNVVFTAWLSRRAEQSTAEEFSRVDIQRDDRYMSVHDLMAKQESQQIISDPRDYQIELYERSKSQNIIAVLDTGSGKTLIAVLLLKHVLEEELENRKKNEPHRVAFFLVDKVALCFQQYAVLEANLNQPVEKLCGDTNIDSFSRAEWERLLTENKVIVCTADVLLNVLGKAFVKMGQINLLIFDEAHHTKKNHVYAKIIKDYYVPALQKDRPRIFGMSASPVDAKEDVEESAARLETLLHSRIATTSDISMLQTYISRPDEVHLSYNHLQPPYLTPLAAEMKCRFGSIRVLEKFFQGAKEAASELGEWCADQLLADAFTDIESNKFEGKLEQEYHADQRNRHVETLNHRVNQIREARAFIEARDFPSPEMVANNVSSKVRVLNDFLHDIYLHTPQSRTLIFVNKRSTAKLLAKILQRIGNPNIVIDTLMGSGCSEPGEESTSVRQQLVTIAKFRNGDINILVATSVAEEGLDVPGCNCVVRFDLYSTMIQYIQSRGRARHKDSKFVSMHENGNSMHERTLAEVKLGEMKMRQFCNAVPEDRLLTGHDYNVHVLLSKEKGLPIYIEPETGAKLTFNSVLMTLDYFVSSLPCDQGNTLRSNFIMTSDGRGFTCEVILPPESPIRSMAGHRFSSKSLAKRSAAFEICLLLRHGGYLDQNLLPIYHKQLPAMRNAQLALNVKATNSYDMLLKPKLWEEQRGIVPHELFVTIIYLDNMRAFGQDLAPLALMTRSPLSKMPVFPVFLNPDKQSLVISELLEHAVSVTSESMQQLTIFTLQVYYDLFNKKFEKNPANMSYWIAPVCSSIVPLTDPQRPLRDQMTLLKAHDVIDWDTLHYVQANETIAWSPGMKIADLEGKFLIDKWDGGRRFFSEKIMPEMRPEDPVPLGCAPAKNTNSILEYSISLYSRSRTRALHTWIPDQPVLKTTKMMHRRNWLDDWSAEDREVRTCAYVCPEPLRISALPAAIAATGYIFPAIIHRFEQYLIAAEAAAFLGLRIQPALALEALTKDSDNTEEHRTEQIHFQRGMGKNYERLEFIGDTFLKMATSIALYAANAGDDEFESHVKRMLMICNKNLFNNARRCGLAAYVRTQAFSRRTWYPEGLTLLEGKGMNAAQRKTSRRHRLGDKSLADVCEALIGAALLSPTEPYDMDDAVRAVTVMVQNPDHEAERFADYRRLYTTPAWQLAPPTAAQEDLVTQIAALDDYRFRSPRLLRAAFTHPSFPWVREHVPSYQRLEFLGDALLDMACVRWLFARYPDRDPQWLTEHKMAMVSNQFLGALCVSLGLHRHLKHHHSALPHVIAEYAAAAQTAAAAAAGRRDYWLQLRSPPKCLADMLEAYIGAIFVDADFDYTRVDAFMHRHVAPFFEDMSLYDDFAHTHPGAALQHLLSSPPLRCGHSRVLAGALPTLADGDHRGVGTGSVFAAAAMVHTTIVATAQASSARHAKAQASARAVNALQGMQRDEFVRRYRCDCREDLLDVNHLVDSGADSGGAGSGGAQDPQQVPAS